MLPTIVLLLAPLAPQSVSRADLAESYLEFERAWLECRPAESRERVRFNREVDAVAGAFFAGNYDRVVGLFGRLTDELRGEWPREEAAFALRRMSAELRPPVVARNGDKDLEVQVKGAELGKLSEGEALFLLVGPSGQAVDRRSPAIEGGALVHDGEWTVPAATLADWSTGRYVVEARVGGARRELRTFWVVDDSVDAVRERLMERARSVGADWDDERRARLEDARRSVEARCELLREYPSDIESAQFLLNPVEHRASLEQELDALERGEDPFARRLGRCWRVTRRGSSILPYVVHAPAAAAGDEPMPVIVAYHGAGGDENMFLDAYGAGALVRLAEQHGILLITPRTGFFSSNPHVFDAMIDSVFADYAVDEDRVYVLGHSMGTSATANLARLRSPRIAAACCIAGAFNFHARNQRPPILLVAGTLDPIVRLEKIVEAHERAKQVSAPVELWIEEEAGHTLLVGDQLPRIVDWLLQHRRTP